MKIQILGCGSSSGVPVLGCDCSVCRSADPKNKRTRQSIFIQNKDTKVLIDPGPDFRRQCLDNNISGLNSILCTHAHQDHVGGFDEVANTAAFKGEGIDIYADKLTLDLLQTRFFYLFKGAFAQRYSPLLNLQAIQPYRSYQVGDIEFYPFEQDHGNSKSLGFKIGSFAYSTDFVSLSDKDFEMLSGIDLWIIQCQKYKPMKTHMHLEKTLSFIQRAKAKKAVLIHMSHEIDYNEINTMLPQNVCAAYDGMVINL